MTGEQGIVRGVSWRDLCPWLVIFRAFRLAVSPSLLALATIGVLVNPLGWRVAEAVFIGEAVREDPGFREFLGRQRQWPRSERAATPGTEHWLRSVDVAIRRPLEPTGGLTLAAGPVGVAVRIWVETLPARHPHGPPRTRRNQGSAARCASRPSRTRSRPNRNSLP